MNELEFVIFSPDRKIPDIKYLNKIINAIGVDENADRQRKDPNFKCLPQKPGSNGKTY